MKRLQYLRQEAKLSQRELGEKCKVGANYICRAETSAPHLGEEQLERLASALGWDGSPKQLLDEIEVQ